MKYYPVQNIKKNLKVQKLLITLLMVPVPIYFILLPKVKTTILYTHKYTLLKTDDTQVKYFNEY